MNNPINIYRVKDPKEKHYTNKGLLFNLPFRLLMVGKSQFSGKSSCIVNLLLQDDNRLYKNEFDGDNIYIFSGSLKTDNKIKMLISQFDIPESNLFEDYSEPALEAIYDLVEEDYQQAIDDKEKPPNSLIILDDIAFSGSLKNKQSGQISRLACQARHINLSFIATAQKYSQLSTTLRENCTGLIAWECSDKQMELLMDDHNTMNKKDFRKMFRERTEKPHTFMVVNYSNPRDKRFQTMNFEPIGSCGKTKSEGCPCFSKS